MHNEAAQWEGSQSIKFEGELGREREKKNIIKIKMIVRNVFRD
jgi:hypothetical protein